MFYPSLIPGLMSIGGISFPTASSEDTQGQTILPQTEIAHLYPDRMLLQNFTRKGPLV